MLLLTIENTVEAKNFLYFFYLVEKILIEGAAKDLDNIIEVNCVIGVAGGQ